MPGVPGTKSREDPTMTLQTDLATLEELPAVVARLRAISDAVERLADIEYAGAGTLGCELDEALECLDGSPGALLYLAGLKHARGDEATFERWDSGVAGRINFGDVL